MTTQQGGADGRGHGNEKAGSGVSANQRQEKARQRLIEALRAEPPDVRLSDVFYEAAEDGIEQVDGEGGLHTPDHGFDCDDVAAVLLPVLSAALGGDEHDG